MTGAMNEPRDEWADRLSEYVDGELTAAETALLEAHLATCARCREAVGELRAVVRWLSEHAADVGHAGSGATAPLAEGWTRLAARIAADGTARPGAPPVPIASMTRGAPRRSWTRDPALRPWLAAAAALVLAAGSVWLAARDHLAGERGAGRPVASARSSPTRPASRPRETSADASVAAWVPTAQYLAAVGDLERMLRDGRDHLRPETIRAIEQSLANIDRAIAESEQALGADPANDFVADYLDAARRRKLRALRRATAAVNAQT
ncbi:MAG: zf-HC2 domain-containing protein [Gemmatimonadaceae bacterium]